jgi:hypothetical protein
MNIAQIIQQTVQNTTQYLVEAATRLFSPSDDQYPNIGVQPFDGDTYSEWR